MSIRVLLLTQWFDPEPTFKGLLFARELVKRGFDVEVVTGFPNYPGGKIYDGYKIHFIQREFIDGVNITRLPLYPSHNGSAVKRIFNYVSFALSALFYCLFFAKKSNVIYAYHPPLTVGVVAVITRFFRRIPVVYDIQDMWPDTLRVTGMLNNERILAFIGHVAKWVYKHVDQIVVLSPGFKHLLIDRGVDKNRIGVVPNWCDEDSLLSPQKAYVDFNTLSAGHLKIVFAGNMGKAQSLNTVIKAAELLQEKEINADFIFIGGGVEFGDLKELANEKSLKNVFFIPQVSMSVIGAYLACADILLVHLKKDPLFSITIPSKTQAYLAIGKPVLMGVEGDAANIVNAAKCGITFEPENVQALVDSVIDLASKTQDELASLGENARKYYIENLSLNSGVNQFAGIFAKLSEK